MGLERFIDGVFALIAYVVWMGMMTGFYGMYTGATPPESFLEVLELSVVPHLLHLPIFYFVYVDTTGHHPRFALRILDMMTKHYR